MTVKSYLHGLFKFVLFKVVGKLKIKFPQQASLLIVGFYIMSRLHVNITKSYFTTRWPHREMHNTGKARESWHSSKSKKWWFFCARAESVASIIRRKKNKWGHFLWKWIHTLPQRGVESPLPSVDSITQERHIKWAHNCNRRKESCEKIPSFTELQLYLKSGTTVQGADTCISGEPFLSLTGPECATIIIFSAKE